MRLWLSYIGFAKKDGARQISDFDQIEVDDSQGSDTKQGEILQRFVAECATTGNEQLCPEEHLLRPTVYLALPAEALVIRKLPEGDRCLTQWNDHRPYADPGN